MSKICRHSLEAQYLLASTLHLFTLNQSPTPQESKIVLILIATPTHQHPPTPTTPSILASPQGADPKTIYT